MEANETIQGAAPRDPASISPSAYALLVMKSHTSIPYAREAAALSTAAQSQPPAPASPAAPEHITRPPVVQPIIAPPITPAAPEHITRPHVVQPIIAPPITPAAPAALSASPVIPLAAGTPGLDVDPIDYWSRVMHFESRYWSIDQLLEDLTATNILEISGGFSFRGLDLSTKRPVYYIDTDLPNIIVGKQKFIDAFKTASAAKFPTNAAIAADPVVISSSATSDPTATGHYELHPLNALDAEAFQAVVSKFPEGPLTIVNEGLLVYLDLAEKQQLCANIRKALLARGGQWITADIYIKRKEGEGEKNDAWRQWSREHHLEEKKFESFHEAETFFHSNGFNIEKEATQDYSRLTSFKQFLKVTSPQALAKLRQPNRPRLHATWRLVLQPPTPPSNSSQD